jgi:hypothetical protein
MLNVSCPKCRALMRLSLEHERLLAKCPAHHDTWMLESQSWHFWRHDHLFWIQSLSRAWRRQITSVHQLSSRVSGIYPGLMPLEPVDAGLR